MNNPRGVWKIPAAAAALVAVDQGVKLIIHRFAANADVLLIPGALRFHPVQNTSLNWVSSMLGMRTPVLVMVLLQAAMLVAVTLIYRYMTYRAGRRQGWLAAFASLLSAGVLCSFLDVTAWGGSLDFVGLFTWFTFDTKDVYLNASAACFLLWALRAEGSRVCAHLGGWGEFRAWLKKRCPIQPDEKGEAKE